MGGKFLGLVGLVRAWPRGTDPQRLGQKTNDDRSFEEPTVWILQKKAPRSNLLQIHYIVVFLREVDT